MSVAGSISDAEALASQTRELSRGSILAESVGNCRAIVVPDLATALEVSNRYAPEHLIVQTRAPRELLDGIVNAIDYVLTNNNQFITSQVP